MCGILGGWTKCQSSENLQNNINNALSLLRHRGPNHKGYDIYAPADGGNLFLAHTRLSIIDLSDSGNQPITDSSGRYSIVFNGEIYNYIELRQKLSGMGIEFNTDTDTEVLLYSWITWKESCLTKLVGMFAFVVFDHKLQIFTCVRDAFGIKPFFYQYNSDSFFFSSEISAILAMTDKDPEPDLQAAYDYLVHGMYDFGEKSFLKNIQHLLPGHLMTVKPGDRVSKPLIKQWWDARKIKKNPNISFETAVQQVRNKFLKNVRLHLRSDVPIGFALSGGIDSSSLVFACRHIDPEIELKTFSFIAEDSAISEEKWVDYVNDAVKSIPHKLKIHERDFIREITDIITAQGEPCGSTSIYAQYKVFELAKKNGVIVTLDGQGADELLAGYFGYPGERLLSLIEGGRFIKALSFAKKWSGYPGRSLMSLIMRFGQAVLPRFLRQVFRQALGKSHSPEWIHDNTLKNEGVEIRTVKSIKMPQFKKRRVIERLAHSLQVLGIPHLLRHEDRNSMAFSIESRVPFLTIDMAELLLSLPEEYLISADGETKHVFREAMRGIVPDMILNRKDKIGFETPEEHWLLTNTPIIRKYIAENYKEIDFINSDALLAEFDSIAKRQKKFSWQIWRWLNYIIWYQQFIKNSDESSTNKAHKITVI